MKQRGRQHKRVRRRPATLAEFLAQSLAENLASLVMVHAIKPCYEMIFSNWLLVIDLRIGVFSGGSGETAVLNAASAQLSNWLGLSSGIACSMTDAKAIDAQHGMEKGITSMAASFWGQVLKPLFWMMRCTPIPGHKMALKVLGHGHGKRQLMF